MCKKVHVCPSRMVLMKQMISATAGYVMLLWFWGSNRKRQVFKDTRKQLSGFVKVRAQCALLCGYVWSAPSAGRRHGSHRGVAWC